jgi:hypothetical protein
MTAVERDAPLLKASALQLASPHERAGASWPDSRFNLEVGCAHPCDSQAAEE